MIDLKDVLIYILSFILGSIPFAVVIGKLFYKTDVRTKGSGNPGATNTLRVLGWKAGIIVLLLDIFKGLAAVLLAYYMCSTIYLTLTEQMTITGALAIAGHLYSPFLNFKGGKGMATTVGVIFGLNPWIGLVTIGIFLIVLLITKYVSLSSMLSVLVFSAIFAYLHSSTMIIIAFCIALPLIIIYRHNENIKRLKNGNESKFTLKGK